MCATPTDLERDSGWGKRGTSFVRDGGVGTLGLAEGSSNVQLPEQEEGSGLELGLLCGESGLVDQKVQLSESLPASLVFPLCLSLLFPAFCMARGVGELQTWALCT